MNASPRTLTIEEFNPQGRASRAASLIRLKGNWLKQAGFHSGAKIQVQQTQPGVLELRVCSPVALSGDYFTALQQLDAVLQ